MTLAFENSQNQNNQTHKPANIIPISLDRLKVVRLGLNPEDNRYAVLDKDRGDFLFNCVTSTREEAGQRMLDYEFFEDQFVTPPKHDS